MGKFILRFLIIYSFAFNQTFHQYETAEVTPKGSFQVGGYMDLIMVEFFSFLPPPGTYLMFFLSPGIYAKLGTADNLEFGVGLSTGPRMTATVKYQFPRTNNAISLHSSLSGYITANRTVLSYYLEPCYFWAIFYGINFSGYTESGNGERLSPGILSYIWGAVRNFFLVAKGHSD